MSKSKLTQQRVKEFVTYDKQTGMVVLAVCASVVRVTHYGLVFPVRPPSITSALPVM